MKKSPVHSRTLFIKGFDVFLSLYSIDHMNRPKTAGNLYE